ncbi:MAG: urate hydroxylase PuuD, partial [Candidatus Marinimicrobia bacterium]|nr:urate hydroxylase PuuD [Candidatus Neomarinimicrobiota bacterium]
MDVMELLQALFRWIHIVAGILWIGILYWFNFANIPFVATLDGDVKKKIFPELLPRTLYWFRWGAAWTWITGVLLLFIIFYHG